MTGVYRPKPFIPHAASLHHTFVHSVICPESDRALVPRGKAEKNPERGVKRVRNQLATSDMVWKERSSSKEPS